MSFEDILAWMSDNIPTIVGYIGTAASAILAVISCWRAHKIKVTCDKILNDARERKTYANCPHCGKKFTLDEITFHLPGGAIDQNLNGTPDDLE